MRINRLVATWGGLAAITLMAVTSCGGSASTDDDGDETGGGTSAETGGTNNSETGGSGGSVPEPDPYEVCKKYLVEEMHLKEQNFPLTEEEATAICDACTLDIVACAKETDCWSTDCGGAGPCDCSPGGECVDRVLAAPYPPGSLCPDLTLGGAGGEGGSD